MSNILKAFINIVNNYQINITNVTQGNNRANNMGEGLETYIKDIFANTKTISSAPSQHIEIIEQTLFETSFIYNNIFYERQLISPLFIPFLEELFHLLKILKIQYTLKKLTQIEHFEAVFINNNFESKNFGTSDKVLIFEKKIDLLESEMVFLRTHASWAKIIIIVPII